jgi:hypothetical protein
LNASTANTLIHYSRWPDGDVNAQFKERIAHLDKAGIPLTEIDIVARDTIDSAVVQACRVKDIDSRSFNRAVRADIMRRWQTQP